MSFKRSVAPLTILAAAGLFIAAVTAQQAPSAPSSPRQQPTRPSTPPRDSSAQPPQQAAAGATGRIAGTVSTIESGRPVKGARVTLSAPQLQDGRSTLTDESGTFDFADLPEGRYTLTAAKTGLVSLSYGQRRPLQPGTPLQLARGQTLRDLHIRLPRGSAIGGQVADESGEPLAGLLVRAMRMQVTQGQRQLVPAGNGQTDDRGQYRIWGLNPGEYYVSAVAPNVVFGDGFGRGGALSGGGRGFIGRGGGPFSTMPIDAGALDTIAERAAFVGGTVMFADGSPQGAAYAPTYYPGVSSARDARPVTVSLGSEALGIDFSLLTVRMARVAGHVTSSDGGDVAGGTVNLVLDDQGAGRGGPFAGNYGARIQDDGTFVISNVPPGAYVLRARTNEGGRGGRGGGGGRSSLPAGGSTSATPRFGSQQVQVTGDLSDVAVVLSPGATMTGTVVLQLSGSTAAPDLSQIRLLARPADASVGWDTNGRVDRSGTFTLEGLPAGPHWLRAQAPAGLSLKAVLVGGHDVIDTVLDIQPGEKIQGASLILTDRVSEINGTMADDRAGPVTDFTVLAFPEDTSLWGPQSRHIMTARPDQNGKFQIRGLPSGRYYVVAIDPTTQGEWFEPTFLEQHRDGAARLTLADGEIKTQDFRVAIRQ